MDFDFNLILVPAATLFTVVWLLDRLVLKQRKNKGKAKENFLITWAYDYWWILAFVVVMRAFLYEPFNIPSSSMKPTLYTGDFIVVNKHQYSLRLPLLHTRVWEFDKPQRGDVVVFRQPQNTHVYFIKRLIAVPGDVVSVKNGALAINGMALPTALHSKTTDAYSKVYNQTITNQKGVSTTFVIRDLNSISTEHAAQFLRAKNPNTLPMNLHKNWSVRVPKGQYFVMGDNRDESADSRFWGFVPEDHIAGKATYVWMHKKAGFSMPNFSKARDIR